MRLTFQQVKKKIEKMVPSGIEYEVDLEAASIAIITTDPARFQEDGLTGRISKEIKRRVEIRPDPSLLVSIEDATNAIRDIIPDAALVQNIWFDPAISVVVTRSVASPMAMRPARAAVHGATTTADNSRAKTM